MVGRGGEVLVENDGGEVLAENDGGEVLAENDGGEVLVENDGEVLVENDGGEVLVENDGGEGLVENGSGFCRCLFVCLFVTPVVIIYIRGAAAGVRSQTFFTTLCGCRHELILAAFKITSHSGGRPRHHQ